jgi:hypothetical protein
MHIEHIFRIHREGLKRSSARSASTPSRMELTTGSWLSHQRVETILYNAQKLSFFGQGYPWRLLPAACPGQLFRVLSS